MEKKEDFQEAYGEFVEEVGERKQKMKKEQEELAAKYKELLEHKNIISRRLMKAFPNMLSREHNDILEKVKKINLH